MMDANGQPVYQQQPMMDANGQPVYQQQPNYSINQQQPGGQPMYQ